MPLHPDICSHCALAMTLTQRAYQVQRPPPEAIKEALLLGIGMGEIGAAATPEVCEECRSYLVSIAAEHKKLLDQMPTEPVAPQATQAPQTSPRAPQAAPTK